MDIWRFVLELEFLRCVFGFEVGDEGKGRIECDFLGGLGRGV